VAERNRSGDAAHGAKDRRVSLRSGA
jgi:hypothetical protein